MTTGVCSSATSATPGEVSLGAEWRFGAGCSDTTASTLGLAGSVRPWRGRFEDSASAECECCGGAFGVPSIGLDWERGEDRGERMEEGTRASSLGLRDAGPSDGEDVDSCCLGP